VRRGEVRNGGQSKVRKPDRAATLDDAAWRVRPTLCDHRRRHKGNGRRDLPRIERLIAEEIELCRLAMT
jgi:hypothetical protein